LGHEFREDLKLIRTKLLTWILAPGIIGICLVLGCGKSRTNDNPYVGNMDDYTYSGQRSDDGCVYRVNGHGEEVCVAEFEGQFVWADYAAPWCPPCVAQAKIIKALETEFADEVVFLTIITSAKNEFQSIPTQETANAWARRFGLDPDKVVAATDRWGMTIPTHILYSPTGQTLYRTIGYYSKEQLQKIMADYIQDWENWSENGTEAEWMWSG
jgi:thiol-disulfide isomerase/thioredoxin